MEITTIVGIVVAVIIMLIGIRLIFKKPVDAAPSLESELHVNSESQQPVIPRHVRDQLQQTTAARIEPTLAEEVTQTEQNAVVVEELKQEDSKTTIETPVNTEDLNVKPDLIEPEVATESDIAAAESDPKIEVQTFNLNNHVEKAEIADFEEESSILDAHLHEQQLVDEESALATAETYVALNIYPERRVLSGDKTLKVLLKYGLRFGEMACFHRYSEDGSKLLFSVLQVTDEGASGFDLETLSTEEVKGLAFFLALPHSDVQIAFDTMDSISRLIAREIDGTVYDQNNQEFTPQMREHWRHQAIDYRSGQAVDA